MNFVTKNLGWILLLLFFLFMLFVISSNGEKTPITQTGSSVMPTGTGAIQEDLDSLVEMLDEDEKITDPVEIQTEEEVISNEVATAT
jgi:hypothetical protein